MYDCISRFVVVYILIYLFILGLEIVLKGEEIGAGQRTETWTEGKADALLVKRKGTKPETAKRVEDLDLDLILDRIEEGETEDQTQEK